MTCTLSVADFREQIRHLVPRLVRCAEQNLGRLQQLTDRFIAARTSTRLPPVVIEPGFIDLELEDDAGDTTHVGISIGDGRGARARLQISDRELLQIIETGGRLATLLASRLRVEGDLAYVLRLLSRATT